MRQLQHVDKLSNQRDSPIRHWQFIANITVNHMPSIWDLPILLMGRFSIPDQIDNYLTYEQT